ncbi:hypothetical protein TNCV_1343311 [Trichonephila clavipes]|nr:hypothetical protein TNCV_1343311 [Trichonephila clavipes]
MRNEHPSIKIEKHKDSDCGSLVIKVTDSWPACDAFPPNVTEDSQCKVGLCSLNMFRPKHPPVGAVGNLEEMVHARHPQHLIIHQNHAVQFLKGLIVCRI